MAWFLALQGSSTASQQSSAHELQDGVDLDRLAQDMIGAASRDGVVAVPAMLPQNSKRKQRATLYIRPAAWGMWTFYQLSEDDRRDLAKENPVLHALTHAANQQRAQAGGVNPLGGPLQPGNRPGRP
ncbi:hypothetical protein [Mycolicibacterium palauense]|uniref:hypothetical protein n=1 Tax=Mycolicibacterium palauense TaxID=2034511 RepID=UPI000BFEC2F1|nr:hypothetical protein [Mycolicibacterium palauense]